MLRFLSGSGGLRLIFIGYECWTPGGKPRHLLQVYSNHPDVHPLGPMLLSFPHPLQTLMIILRSFLLPLPNNVVNKDSHCPLG